MIVWLGLTLLSGGLQWQSGAWQSDFGGHADEAAHVVTGLMVRDYLAGGFLEQWHPLRYAEAYYERLPKVAIGHYPPGFYVLEALWFLPARVPGAALMMMAALSGSCGWLVWWMGRRLLKGAGAALALGILFCVLPLVRTYTGIVMSDLLLVLLMGLAVVTFARFVDEGRGRDAFGFGLLAAAAILTKAGGLVLAIVPPLTIALTGKWRIVLGWRLWLAVVPVALLGLPWMLATSHITLEGKSDTPALDYFFEALRFYPAGFVDEIGGLATGLLVIGAVAMLSGRWGPRRRAIPALPAVFWSLSIGLPVFFCMVPTGSDVRYLLPMVPGSLILAGMVVEWMSDRLLPGRFARWVVVGLALGIYADTWRPVEKRHTGATEVIDWALKKSREEGVKEGISILVSAGPSSEGALIAAVAFLGNDKVNALRAGKILASSDWMGRGYELKYRDTAGLRAILRDRAVDFVVVEIPSTRGGWEMPEHQQELLTQLDESPEFGKLLVEVKSARRHDREAVFRLYRVSP